MEDQQLQSICEECKVKASKYKCPGCSVRSCSLPCVKAHKQRTGCTGKRSRTHFVPISQFDDNLLLSDYNLLEDIKRVADSAQRTRTQLRAYPQLRLPFHLRNLRNAAASRRTKLLLLPSGMSKREKNQTRFDQRKKFISWTIEWRFHSTDVVLLDHGVHEDTNLFPVIEKHLKPEHGNPRLKQFYAEHLDTLKFFIRKYHKGAKAPFCELDIRVPLKQQLANVVILEYPVIHVFLPSHTCDFDVVKDAHPVSRRPEIPQSTCDDRPSDKGVTFKEEEIEEVNGSSDPQVYDLTKNAVSSPPSQINMPEKAVSNFPCVPSSERSEEGSVTNSSINSILPGFLEDADFDFDQDLIDVYSDLISQINPDDFLDLDGELAREVEERKPFPNSGGILCLENELEEGEIAE